jgi:hypothetical protein
VTYLIYFHPIFILFSFFFHIAGIINRGDSFRRRRSRSNSLAPTSPMHHPVEEVLPANPGPVDSHKVLMLGAPGVGKTSLISQFKTSECINAYDNGRGKSYCCLNL